MDQNNVVPMRQPIALPPLYELEQDLVALLDTEAMVTPEQEAEFQKELGEALAKTVAKRDRVGAFLKTLEAQAKFAGEEIQRLQARKRTLENVEKRLREYVVRCIEDLGTDPKGKLRKLEGERFTLSARACPASLEVTEADKVPLEYKTVTVTMPAVDWLKVVEERGIPFEFEHSFSVDTAKLKAFLTGPNMACDECGGIGMVDPQPDTAMPHAPVRCPKCGGACSVAPSVPGADLIVGRNSLQVR